MTADLLTHAVVLILKGPAETMAMIDPARLR